MDALEFGRQRRRMCGSIRCVECTLFEYSCSLGEDHTTEEDDKRVIEAVEQWAKEHPERTRQSDFLKMFPDTKTDERGVLSVSPCVVDRSYGVERNKANCCIGKTCAQCRRDFWIAPMED